MTDRIDFESFESGGQFKFETETGSKYIVLAESTPEVARDYSISGDNFYRGLRVTRISEVPVENAPPQTIVGLPVVISYVELGFPVDASPDRAHPDNIDTTTGELRQDVPGCFVTSRVVNIEPL